eukprot:70078-Chlamydomonas_euryale.AAC.1
MSRETHTYPHVTPSRSERRRHERLRKRAARRSQRAGMPRPLSMPANARQPLQEGNDCSAHPEVQEDMQVRGGADIILPALFDVRACKTGLENPNSFISDFSTLAM